MEYAGTRRTWMEWTAYVQAARDSARARQTRDSPLLWPVLTQRIVLRDARYCSVLGDARIWCYVMWVTGIAYGAMQCAVLREGMGVVACAAAVAPHPRRH
eukprot:3936564-Rhodomonas_salina.3